MSDPELRAKGREIRRLLVGDVCADRLDREVYTDPHMEKFGQLTQEVVFAQLWPRPGLDYKTKSMITVITDISTNNVESLGLHVRFCRIHGWSEDEIVDAMLHCLPYIGIPLVRKAILVASQAFEEMRVNDEMPAGAAQQASGDAPAEATEKDTR